MPDLWMDVDAALAEVPVNLMPLIDDGDFKTIEDAVAYNAAGMDLVWNFTTTAGATTQTAVTPTTIGNYDWVAQGNGMYTIEIPASGGASINNDTEGFGWFTGVCTGVLPWRGPVVGFRAAGLNNLLIDDAFSSTRGLSGTALPNAAAEAAGGLYTRGTGAGQINQPANGSVDTNIVSAAGTAWASGAITAASIASNAITAAKIAANAITSSQLAADSITASQLDSTALAEIADAVWDEALAGHTSAGTTGKALSDAGSAGDPWGTSLPGAYNAGEAGYILGTNLDALISSRMATFTLPTNFSALSIDGSGRVDVGKTLGQAVTLDANNVLNVSTKYIGGTLQTARDLGASVLLSSGTGTGQVKLSSGYVAPNWGDVGNPTTANNLSGTTVGVATVAGTVNALANNSITAAAIATDAFTAAAIDPTFGNELADALLNRTDGVEAGITPKQGLRAIAAAAGGVLTGAATATVGINELGGTSATRILATVDADGNRPAVTLTL
jgi:hypothetical protein